ncbi:Deoxyguanosinetriphosphate triphosphohydrolase [Chitinispirillum alkaliphilum]|nr:Deoxyguanosinetriphosphate triphosphohydrolase [Chitinispirillum alkaliphilum]
MDWERLLSLKRVRESSTASQTDRSQYQRDYDRIIFSKPFRRLQKKTQVFPLPEHDFIHTRLTHSLETSCVGRTLGMAAGITVLKENPELSGKGISPYDFAAVVAAASVAHDIGNPPFGHSGEDAIGDFFKNEGAHFLDGLTDSQKLDFTNFEGNAMGFRLMVYTLPAVSSVEGGINLTYATLGAFSKYPREITPVRLSGVSGKKHSFFQSEKAVFTQIADHLGMIKRDDSNGAVAYYRHPLAFLVEAADDISYLLMDLEDGYNLKLVEYSKICDCLNSLILKKDGLVSEKIHDEREKVGYLRAIAISSLIQQVSDVYAQNLPEIMEGKFDEPLVDKIHCVKELKDLKIHCRNYVYTYRKVLETEAAGFEVIGGLLYEFLDTLPAKTKKAEKIQKLLPQHYIAKGYDPQRQRYEEIMHIVQFVAGMTDTFAIDTYRAIKGIKLPNY